jgi:hypothetical protein
MSAEDFTTALVTNGQSWLVLSLSAVLPILWTFTLILHFSRPYVIGFLQTLTLRFGADVWWLGYVLMRDALMLVTLSVSLIFLFPNLYIGLGLPLTAPLATVVLFWALATKFLRDTDDDPGGFGLVSILLVIASALYIVPQIYGLEAGDQLDRLNTFGLGWIPSALSAQSDSGVNGLAWPILIVSMLLFAGTGAVLFTRFVLGLGRAAPDESSMEAAQA